MSKSAKGTLLTLLGASCWGLCAMSAKYITGIKAWDPLWMVCLRLLTASAVFLAISAFADRDRRDCRTGKRYTFTSMFRDPHDRRRILLIAVFAFAVCQTTYFAAIDRSNAGIATAIQQTAPVFVMIYALYTEKRHASPLELGVLAAVVLGAFLLATNGNVHSLVIPLSALVLGIISSITCACYTIMPRPLIMKYGTFRTIGWGMLLAGICLIPVSRFWEFRGTFDARAFIVFAFIVAVGTVTAFACFLYGITIVGPVKGSIYGLIEPVVATLSSAVILRQSFSVADCAGMAIILTGVALLSVRGK